jgi:hypothetical protein
VNRKPCVTVYSSFIESSHTNNSSSPVTQTIHLYSNFCEENTFFIESKVIRTRWFSLFYISHNLFGELMNTFANRLWCVCEVTKDVCEVTVCEVTRLRSDQIPAEIQGQTTNGNFMDHHEKNSFMIRFCIKIILCK